MVNYQQVSPLVNSQTQINLNPHPVSRNGVLDMYVWKDISNGRQRWPRDE